MTKMNKRERRAAEAARKAAEPVQETLLQYWATWTVGGSGMGVSTQTMIKKMAREILEARGIEIAKTHQETTQPWTGK